MACTHTGAGELKSRPRPTPELSEALDQMETPEAAANGTGVTPRRGGGGCSRALHNRRWDQPVRNDDSELVVFCFTKPEDAEAFCQPFGGEHLHAFLRATAIAKALGIGRGGYRVLEAGHQGPATHQAALRHRLTGELVGR